MLTLMKKSHVQHVRSVVEISERFLPKPTVEEFKSDPMDYWGFVSPLNVHVAAEVDFDDLKVVFLLQRCNKKV